jgi:hypothetical protein
MGEPVEETRERREPLLGWRLWRLRGGRLESWAATYVWEPGDNRAYCLTPLFRCQRSPGPGCRCGFWALFSLLDTLEHARRKRSERSAAVGLVRAWGEVAVHGREGFRAEHAAVVCLFTDWIWDVPILPCPNRGWTARWRWRLQRAVRYPGRPVPQDPRRPTALQEAAAAYGVPLLSLHDALRFGLLAELGMDERRRREVEAWVDLRHPPPE